MQESKAKDAEKPLTLRKITIRDLDESPLGSSAPQVSTIEGCQTTLESCMHHCHE